MSTTAPGTAASDDAGSSVDAAPVVPPDDVVIEQPAEWPADGPDAHEIVDPGTWVGPRARMHRFWTRRLETARRDRWRSAEAIVSFVVVVAVTVLVVGATHPSLVLRNSTPTGGDMGSHVWGPMYLMRHLLPKGRLSGWTPDWYDGFPAYQFYMVVPSLFIVALYSGIRNILVFPAALVMIGVALSGWWFAALYRFRRLLLVVGLIGLVLVVPVPYNVAFKLVTILGLATLPVVAWAFGKLTDLPFPIPPLLAVAAAFYVFNREPTFSGYGNILGGNMTSTMAGEFAFSISLSFAVLYLGFAIRGLRTGRYRAISALLFAMAGLCHLIPAFFVLACTAVLFLFGASRARLRWLATMVPVAALLTAFWVVPFYWQRAYVNDMGWEKLPVLNSHKSIWTYLTPQSMLWALVLAALGLVVSAVFRYTSGLVLGVVGLLVMVAFVRLPEAQLWNARLLPFLYLCVFFLAAIGVGEVVRSVCTLVARDPDRPLRAGGVVAVPIAALVAIAVIGLPVDGLLPGQSRSASGEAHLLGLSTKDSNPVSSWAEWNYKGLEAKEATASSGGYPEYHDVVQTMARLGTQRGHGCGRAFWEYSNERLNGYGTPMALMMLPYFTDGCIGSQEGLYFEASATVPYHFLMQAELSQAPSNPQRNLPYPTLDVATGVKHLQMLGVKYYMASTTQAISAANQQPSLTQVALSGPWHIYQVADAPMVEGLRYEPVVWSNVQDGQAQWLSPTVAWFLDPSRWDVPFASSGPKSWARAEFSGVPNDLRRVVTQVHTQLVGSNPIDPLPKVAKKRLARVNVSKLQMDDDGISFDVDRTGVPVLVKASFFPNWHVSGADGPYRVSPNLMVVVPRSHHVSLTYGRASVDYASMGLTGLGVLGLIGLWRLPAVVMPERRRRTWLGPRPAAAAGSDPGDEGSASDAYPPPPPGAAEPLEMEPFEAEPVEAEPSRPRVAEGGDGVSIE